MNPDVSIIIPTYNAEKTLEETLDSVCNQSFENIEIICIDNKSGDKTIEIIEKYAKKDKRIIICKNNENLKQGIARNFGIKMAKGKYIFFVDSDDLIIPECIEKLYKKSEEMDSDVTICQWALLDDKTKKINKNHTYALLKQIPEEFNNKVFNWRDIKNSLFWQSSVPWDKIYKKSFLIEKEVEFPGNIFFEDNVFVYDALLKASKIAVLREILINYRINRQGAVTNTRDKTFFDYLKIFNLIGDNLKKINIYDEMKCLYLDYKIITLMWWHKKIKLQYKKEFYRKIRQDFNNIEITQEDRKHLRNKTMFLYDRVIKNPFWKYYPLSFWDKVYRIEKSPYNQVRIIFSTFEKWTNYEI